MSRRLCSQSTNGKELSDRFKISISLLVHSWVPGDALAKSLFEIESEDDHHVWVMHDDFEAMNREAV